MCTCCHRNNLLHYDCIIFLKQNYNFNIPAVANALSKWYQEIRQREFICKPCHKELKDGKYTKNIQNCPNSDMFGSNVNHDQHTQDNVEQSRTHSTNNVTCDFFANDTIQPTICTNYCLCTCCHNTDIPRSQCIILKESKYNFNNTIVVEALSNRFSTPTSAEYICKKCHKDLLQEIMPKNCVALHIKLTSYKPQQICVHCNTVPTGKYLAFDKTKYGQNTIVSQMTENNQQNIICNKCCNAIWKETLVTCLRCTKIWKKSVHWNLIWTDTPHQNTTYKKWQNHRKPTVTYAKVAIKNYKKNDMCVVKDRCRNMYAKCIKKKTDFSYFVVSQCLQHLANSIHEVQYICTSCNKALKQTSDENPLVPYHAKYANAVTGAKVLKALNKRPEYVCTCCHHMLFCKTVQQFHIKDYDMSYETVKECLSYWYVMKLYRHTSH